MWICQILEFSIDVIKLLGFFKTKICNIQNVSVLQIMRTEDIHTKPSRIKYMLIV